MTPCRFVALSVRLPWRRASQRVWPASIRLATATWWSDPTKTAHRKKVKWSGPALSSILNCFSNLCCGCLQCTYVALSVTNHDRQIQLVHCGPATKCKRMSKKTGKQMATATCWHQGSLHDAETAAESPTRSSEPPVPRGNVQPWCST